MADTSIPDGAELVERLRNQKPYCCDPGRYGRCKECPAAVIEEAADRLDSLTRRVRELEEEIAPVPRSVVIDKLRERAERAEAALAELVRLKDLKDWLDAQPVPDGSGWTEWDDKSDEYRHDKPLAWEAARALLSASPEPQQQSETPHA